MGRFARQAYWLSMLTFVVHDRVEVLVLGALTTSTAVGLYSASVGAANAAMSLGPAVVSVIFFPLLAADWARAVAGARRRAASIPVAAVRIAR